MFVKERNLQQTLASMSKICRAIRACFLALVVILAGGLAALILITLLNGQETSSSVIASVVYTTVGGGFAILILWNFSLLFEAVVKGDPPLSEIQADRLKAIAIIAAAYVILDLLFSVRFIYEPNPDLGFGMILNNGIAEPTINLNVGMLAFSAIMYSLSAIFRMLRCYSSSATKPCKGAVMPIIPRLDRVMADRKMSVNELSQRIDISPVNISRMRRATSRPCVSPRWSAFAKCCSASRATCSSTCPPSRAPKRLLSSARS